MSELARNVDARNEAQSPTRVDELPPIGGSAFSAGFFAGIVAVCDLAGILVSGAATHLLHGNEPTHDLLRHLMAAALFSVLATLAMNSTGLYHFAAIANPTGQIFRIAAVMVAVFLLLAAAAVALDVSGMFSLSWGLLWIAATVGVLVLCRTLVARFIRTLARTGRLGRRILIYGATDQAKKLIERIERLGEPWNHIIGVFDDRISRVGPTVGRYPVMGDLEDLIAWGRENRLVEVLVALAVGVRRSPIRLF